MVPSVALGVLAGTVLLVLATVVHRAGRSRPDNRLFAAVAVLAGVHVMTATLRHLGRGIATMPALSRFALLEQTVVAGLVVLFAGAFATARRPSAWHWLLAAGACVVGGWAAASSGFIDDLPRASALIVAVPYTAAAVELLRAAYGARGARRNGLLGAASVMLLRVAAGFVLAAPWLGTPVLLETAERVAPVHAYLDVALLLVVGLVILRYRLLDVRRVFREAAVPLAIAVVVAVYVAAAVAAVTALDRRAGARAAMLAVLLPLTLALWAAWTWHDALERASAALDPKRRVRREVLERVVAVTGRLLDAEAVLAMVRASMMTLFDGAQVQFRRAEGNGLMPGISSTIPQALEGMLMEVSEPVVQGSALGRRGATDEIWSGMDAALLVPVRRNQTLYGVFELRIAGRTHSDELATAAALADHLAMKLENMQLYSFLGRAGRELADVKSYLEDLIESLPVGVVALVGPELRVRSWNPAEARRTGIPPEQALGKRYLEEVASSHIAPAIAEAIRSGPREPMSFPNVDWSGEERGASVDVTVAPLRARGLGGERGCVLMFVDATARNALQRDLEEYRRLAALGQFAAAIAHDVRTPLSSMRMSVQILRSKARLSPDDAEYFDLILESMARLSRQVDELVEFTKPALLRIETVGVREVVLDACRDLADKASDKGVEVRAAVASELTAPVDEAKLRQALANLLCNAIEASAPGSVVEIEGELAAGDQVLLTVRDRGVGIAEGDLQRIWEPFYTNRPDGTGLGLPIVRKNIAAHGGTIEVWSRPGEGTRLEIRLPAQRATEVVVPIEECRRPAVGE